MLKTNYDKLVKISVMGEITNPIFRKSPYKISANGIPMVLPSVGGITYNVRVGDSATGLAADHIEPGVSISNKEKNARFPREANTALNVLACIGNEVKVVSGKAVDSKGVVTGKHGGIEHVIIDFQTEILDKMLIGDKIHIKAFGVGLKLLDFPDIKIMNIDPKFLEAIDPKPSGLKLEVPVTKIIPASIMGSGLGADHTYSGDYDIQLFDECIKIKYGLEDLKLGDLVAIKDADHSYGRIYRKGSMTVGIIVHSDCIVSGHGPGVTTLFTSKKGIIKPKIDSKANIAKLLNLRKDM